MQVGILRYWSARARKTGMNMLRFLRRLVTVLFLLVVATLAFVHFVLLESSPRVQTMSLPAAEDVKAARDFVKGVESKLVGAEPGSVTIRITPDQLNSVATLGARFTKGYRGTFIVGETVVIGDFSVPIPWVGGERWLNVTGVVPEFRGAFRADEVRIGGLNLPPSIALGLVRLTGNLVVGDSFGTTILSVPQSMEITESDLAFDVIMGEVGDNGLFSGVFSSLRGQELPSSEEVQAFEARFVQAIEQGRLPDEGSFLPYVQFALDDVVANASDASLPNSYTAAMIALAKICGAGDFGLVVSGIRFEQNSKLAIEKCKGVTLNERIDSRRHFITAAAIQAISNRGYSVTVGELKELHDTISSGGFDFTDLSANNSGIRMSDKIMSGTIADLVTFRERITQENDVIISYDNIPAIMSGDDFATRYGDIDSPEYKEMLAFIETRIDQLAVHQ